MREAISAAFLNTAILHDFALICIILNYILKKLKWYVPPIFISKLI